MLCEVIDMEIRISFRVDKELYRRIKDAAWHRRITVSEYVRLAVLRMIKLDERKRR